MESHAESCYPVWSIAKTHMRIIGLRFPTNRLANESQLRRFRSSHGPINNLFRCGRHLMRAAHYRMHREQAFVTWHEVTELLQAA
jgi:hypothetical protein